MKKGLKRILILMTVLLLIGATVAVVILATGGSEKSAGDAKLKIEATNLSFQNAVYIKYAVSAKNVSAGDVSLLVWTSPVDEYVKGTEAYVLENVGSEKIDGVNCLIFNFEELAASQMVDEVYARAYVNVNGVDCYSEPKKYSILQYAYNKLGKTGTMTDDAELVALLERMLEVGALTQKYTNYKTDRLATDDFYEIKIAGGVLDDGFSHGLFKPGEVLSVKAPVTSDGFDFVGWRNSAGKIVSTSTEITITVEEKNEKYSAVYQGNTTDKLEYTVNEDGFTYSVSGMGECTDANIVIPSVVSGKLVTGIADGAFKDQTGIKSITLTNNVTSIGAEAFKGCTSLTAIYFDGSEHEWGKISFGNGWNAGAGSYKLYFAAGNDWELGGVPLN